MLNHRVTSWAGALALVVLLAIPFATGCGSSSVTPTATPVLDLAVGNGDYDNEDNRVFVWLDALNNPAIGRVPDVLLEPEDELEYSQRVRYVRMAGEQLFVLATSNNYYSGQIMIWNDFRNIEGNPSPDITLGHYDSGLSHPNYMAIHDGDLYVSNRGYNEVLIFRDVLTLEDGDEPDVILGNDDLLRVQPPNGEHHYLSGPNGLAVSDTGLYVSLQDSNKVFVYWDPKTVETGDQPDVVLGNPEPEEPQDPQVQPLFTGSQFAGVKHCFLEGNTLYVTCTRRRDGQANGVWAFSPANALTNYQAPDWIVGGPGYDDYPMCVRVGGGRLWVSTRDYQTGLLGYDLPVAAGQLPDIALMDQFFGDSAFQEPWDPEQGRFTFIPGHVDEFVTPAGGLVGVSRRSDAVFGYLDAASATTNQAPDYVLWFPGMQNLYTIDAVVR